MTAPQKKFDPAADLQARIERLTPDLRIAVVFGGDKSVPGSVIFQAGNSRSWKSYVEVAEDIAAALRRIGFRRVELIPDDMRLLDRLRRGRIDIAWLNTGGVQGNNPTAHAASMLEMAGVPYIGQEPLVATMLDNKHAFKAKMACAGIPTAAFSVWDMGRGDFRPDINSRFRRAFGDYCGPFVVKPVSGRASLHVHVVEKTADLPEAVRGVYEITRNLVLIEEYLPGREFCVAVCGPVVAREGRLFRGRGPFAFGAIERSLSADEKIFTSMDNRPITSQRFRVLDPRREAGLVEDLHRLGGEIFLEFNLNTITRIDIRQTADGRLSVLEANPKPDLKRPSEGRVSLISAGLPDCGMSYEDLILSLFADRLDVLLRTREGCVGHIADLAATMHASPGSMQDARDALALFSDSVADASVGALRAVLRVAETGSRGETAACDAEHRPEQELITADKLSAGSA